MSSFPSRLYSDNSAFELPDLVGVQRHSYSSFVNGKDSSKFSEVFASAFPVVDSYDRAVLEFVSCTVGEPKHSKYDCIVRGFGKNTPTLSAIFLSDLFSEVNIL